MDKQIVKHRSDLAPSLISNKFVEIVQSGKIIDDDIKSVKVFLKKIFVLLGIGETNMPTQMEFDFLAKKVRETFRMYTMKDIELAIDLVNEDKINYNLNLYDKPFSIPFLAGLMKKYKDYRNKNKDYLNALRPQDEAPEPSKEQIMEEMKAGVLELYENVKNNTATFDDYYWYYYNYLERDLGIIKLTYQEKQDILKWSEEYVLLKKKEETNSFKFLMSGVLTDKDDKRIKNTAKERALHLYLSELSGKGYELKKIIDERVKQLG